jgi:hypothetical protein
MEEDKKVRHTWELAYMRSQIRTYEIPNSVAREIKSKERFLDEVFDLLGGRMEISFSSMNRMVVYSNREDAFEKIEDAISKVVGKYKEAIRVRDLLANLVDNGYDKTLE